MDDEHREYPRIDDNTAIRWRVLDEAPPEQAEAGLQVNISGGGIRFQSLEPLETGTMLALQLKLPGFPSGIIALARVVWCDSVSSARSGLLRLVDLVAAPPPAFEVGCEFHWVGWESSDAQKAVRSYLKDQLDG